MMYTFQDIQSGQLYHGDELTFFVDDVNNIGEVYLDDSLIFQEVDVHDEEQLELAFYENFIDRGSDGDEDTYGYENLDGDYDFDDYE